MKKIILFVGFLSVFSFVSAQDYKTKAEFLYLFTRMTHFENYTSKIFVVNVFGDENFVPYLKDVFKNDTVAGLPVVVLKANKKSMYDCNILFWANKDGVGLETAQNFQNVLVIANEKKFFQDADIVFDYKQTENGDSTLIYKLNLNNLKNKRISYSVELLGFSMINQ